MSFARAERCGSGHPGAACCPRSRAAPWSEWNLFPTPASPRATWCLRSRAMGSRSSTASSERPAASSRRVATGRSTATLPSRCRASSESRRRYAMGKGSGRWADAPGDPWPPPCSSCGGELRGWCGVLASARETAVGAVAGIPIIHALADGIQIESGATIEWSGTSVSSDPVVIRHEVGNALPVGMRSVLEVPPWCTFHLDSRGEPASLFHAVFGEVDRLLSCEEPGASYIVRYAERPREPVVALQSELTAYSFALSARGVGLIAHSCAFVAPNGTGVLCPGVSGTGKTTLARLLQRHVPEITVLTDDRAVVTRGVDGLALWGSPWPGAARIASGKSASLATIVFIRHGRFCAVRPVT